MRDLLQQIEGLLFVAGRPVELRELAVLTGAPPEDIATAIETLEHDYSGRGLTLVRALGKVEMMTAPAASKVIASFLETEMATPLTKPALETLAIVIDKQPVTKQAVEDIRGVVSDQIIKNLLSRTLIEEVGRSSEPGRPGQDRRPSLPARQGRVVSASRLGVRSGWPAGAVPPT